MNVNTLPAPNKQPQIRKQHSGKQMNVSIAFGILGCNTLRKKLEYRKHCRKLLPPNHQDKALPAETEKLYEISDAANFLDDYHRKLEVLLYRTGKISFLWILFIFLKSSCERKRASFSSNKKITEEIPEVPVANRKILDLIANSSTLFISELFLLWWIISLQN